ncbi:hypothetical protein B0J15DRAFT_62556 [Fusarium solani]|uniref:BZIP domain-containing protein n=1 Tax=Fusarium solani TaxID=169388 RepID=A0A9P9H1X8_FUSSL|nr:uncharacterized protein B0J15DRAFT_62556 [Fusarium solani]KAH7248377.1 hypothetical protein B0J15DRAFT_62556 [Fusarium solani]
MENDSTFGMSYTSESPLWEQWLSVNQRVPLCSSEDKSSTANIVYTQTGPLFDGFLFHSNTGLTGRWHDISHVADYTNPWNGLNHVIEHTPTVPVSEHKVSEEASPLQGHWQSSSTLRNSNPKQDCYPDNLASCKSTSRTPLGDGDINAQAKKTTRHSTIHRTRHVSGNGVHPAQRGNSRVKRIQEQNRIASNKLRAKQREEQLRLESREQDLERIHRDLSTCVADLSFEIYELKMQLLQHSECNCTLIQNYLVHESSRYVQAFDEKSQ